jgi:hypothetical protein
MKLSTRRQLTIGLGIACAGLALFAVVQRFQGIGRGYTILDAAPQSLDATLTAPLKKADNILEGQGVYLEIDSRSLFTDNRLAAPKAAPVVEAAKPAIPVVPLTAQLIGVVITPNKKVALLRSAGGDQTFRLKEGMPFPGELAGWRVSRIEARKVTFDGGDVQGSTELKLDVAKGGAAPGFVPAQMPGLPQPMNNSAAAPSFKQPMPTSMPQPTPTTMPGGAMVQPPPPPPPSADQAAREAEVQRIIEERRAQMRAEAERLNSGKQ